MKTWGIHLILDCGDCNRKAITNRTTIEEFSKELVKAIDMVAYGQPKVVHFADHDEEKAGYTLVQLIETSNITAHFCDKSGDGYIDVFSCKDFDPQIVINVVRNYFGPGSIRARIFERQAPKVKPVLIENHKDSEKVNFRNGV